MRDHDELLRRYLLGKLEIEERSRLDERLLREEDLFEMAEAAEADLLDDYAHDRLVPEEREQVAQRLASSPRSRSRLALIQGLGRIADARNVIDFPVARRKLSRFERAAAMAAMLTVAVLSSWLATRSLELVQPPQVAEIPVPAPPPPAPRHQPVPPAATPPLPGEPSGEIVAESTPPETPAPQPAAPLVIQLALSTFRGDDMIPQENVPPGTERVQLHLQLDEADKAGYASFQAAVKGAGPELRVVDLEPGEIDGKWTLVLELDPKLPEGRYVIEVWGVTASGSVEQITYKELDIQRNASAGAGTPD
ncbi:MAG TPA: hypothetical protein VNW71_08295 [Thermoanaerobaculia bacterium]|nr:hypothetical protein [Thermoanaerobaculia bacterium]